MDDTEVITRFDHIYTQEEMVKRVARAAVREHTDPDPYDPDSRLPDMSDVCPGTEAPSWLKEWIKLSPQQHTRDFLNMRKMMREDEMMMGGRFPDLGRSRSVYEIMKYKLYKVKGPSRYLNNITSYGRTDGILIEVEYAEKAHAGYEVGPKRSQGPVLWYD